jgi:hypothetical protein
MPQSPSTARARHHLSAWVSLTSVAALTAALASAGAACSSSEAAPALAVASPIPLTRALLTTQLATWRGAPLKRCTVAGVFPGLDEVPASGGVGLYLDATIVRERLGAGLWIRAASGETVVLGAPPSPTVRGSNAHVARVVDPVSGHADLKVSTEIVDGDCIVRFDGVEQLRTPLWSGLPVAIHARPQPGGAPLATLDGTVTAFAAERGGTSGYLEIDALRVVVTGLAADVPRARALLARSLRVTDRQLAGLVTAGPGWLDSVRADGAFGPTPIIATGARGVPPLEHYLAPTLALPPGAVASGAAGARTLQVVLSRRDGAAAAPVAVPVRIAIEPSSAGRTRVRLLAVDAPVAIPAGPEVAARCLTEVADAALAYTSSPARAGGSPRYPIAVVPAIGAVPAAWLTAPCAPLTADFAAAIRADRGALARVGSLLDATRYGTDRILPHGLGPLLARIAPDAASLASLAREAAPHVALTAGLASQKALLADARYGRAPAAEQEARRALVWHAALVCREPITPALRARLLAVPLAGVDGELAGMVGCPDRG